MRLRPQPQPSIQGGQETPPVSGTPPVASFTFDESTEGFAPHTVTFYDTSIGQVTSRMYRVNATNYTDAPNPFTVVLAEGDNAVSLQVENAAGNDRTADVEFTVVAQPAATITTFTIDVITGTSPLTVVATIDISYVVNQVSAWIDWGDGTVEHLAPGFDGTKTHVYTTGTNRVFSPSVSVGNETGKDNDSLTVTVNAAAPPGSATVIDMFVKQVASSRTMRGIVAFDSSTGPTSVAALSVLNSAGTAVPCDFRIISRWGLLTDTAARIRVLHVYFRGESAGTALYRLQTNALSKVDGGFVVTQDASWLTVSRGTDSWRISKLSAGLFDRVMIDGLSVVPSGTAWTKTLGVPTTTLNFSGTTCVIVTLRFTLATSVYVDLRVTFLEPRDTVVEIRLANELGPNSPNQTFGLPYYLDQIGVKFPIHNIGSLEVNGVDSSNDAQWSRQSDFRPPISWAGGQDISTERPAGIPASAASNPTSAHMMTPEVYTDDVVVRGLSGGVAIGWRHFSESAPKEIRVHQGEVLLSPWPDDPDYRPWPWRGNSDRGQARVRVIPLDGYPLNSEAPANYPSVAFPVPGEAFPVTAGTAINQLSPLGKYRWNGAVWVGEGYPGFPIESGALNNYYVPSAWHTDRILLRWFGDTVPADVYTDAHVDIVALTDLDRYWSTKAFGPTPVIPHQPASVDGDVNRSQLLDLVQVDDAASEPQSGPGIALTSAPTGYHWGLQAYMRFAGDSPTAVHRRGFGRDAFGGAMFSPVDVYTHGNYDPPAHLLRDFLRTGDIRFLTHGETLALWRRNYAQVKGDGTMWATGGDWQEVANHPCVSSRSTTNASHTWCEGTKLHYLITGDEWSRESLLLYGQFFSGVFNRPSSWKGTGEPRTPGWATQGLVAIDTALGPVVLSNGRTPLEEARAGVTRYVEFETGNALVQWSGESLTECNIIPGADTISGNALDVSGNGYVLTRVPSGPFPRYLAQWWTHAVYFNGLCQLMEAMGVEEESDDTEAWGLMTRMASWILSVYSDGGTDYRHHIPNFWYPAGRKDPVTGAQQANNNSSDSLVTSQLCGVLAWADHFVGGSTYLTPLERVFRTCVRYVKASVPNPTTPLGNWSYAASVYDGSNQRIEGSGVHLLNWLFSGISFQKQLYDGPYRHLPQAIAQLRARSVI